MIPIQALAIRLPIESMTRLCYSRKLGNSMILKEKKVNFNQQMSSRVKLIVYSLLFLFIISCTPSKNSETATESTLKGIADTVETQVEESSTPLAEELVPYSATDETVSSFSGITQNFPEVSLAVLTNDSLEIQINNRMAELIQAYDTLDYQKITASYVWERPYCSQGQEGPCTMTVEKAEETKTWFFDRNHQLRVFSKQYKINTSGNYEQSTLYLFSGDSMIAIHENTEDGTDAGLLIDQLRIVQSSCPKCGMSASNFEGSINGGVSYLNENDLNNKEREFYQSMPELISILKAGRKKATEDGDDFIFTVNRTEEGKAEEKSKAITFPVTFRVTQNLYPYFISKQ